MKRSRRFLGVLLTGLLLAVSGFTGAQEKKEPYSSTLVPRGFRMYLVADGRFEEDARAKRDPDKKDAPIAKDIRVRVGKLHDPVTDHGLYSVIGVFVRALPKDKDDAPIPKDENDPAIKVLKFEQELAKKYRAQRLGAFMTFLTLTKDFAEDDDRYARINEVDTLVKAAMVPYVQVGIAEGKLADGTDPQQVKDWGLGEADQITIVLYRRLKIVKTWKFKADAPPTDKELQELADEVAVLMGKEKGSDK